MFSKIKSRIAGVIDSVKNRVRAIRAFMRHILDYRKTVKNGGDIERFSNAFIIVYGIMYGIVRGAIRFLCIFAIVNIVFYPLFGKGEGK